MFLPTPEKQYINKHVESLWRICLDTGSSPVGSTTPGELKCVSIPFFYAITLPLFLIPKPFLLVKNDFHSFFFLI